MSRNTPFPRIQALGSRGRHLHAADCPLAGDIAADLQGPISVTRPHLIDIMATCMDLAGAQHPTELAGQPTVPLQGVSLTPALTGKPIARPQPLFWEHEGNRAVRQGGWKLVAKGARGPWELYEMKSDRAEMHNLADKHPERVKAMASLWNDWAVEAQAQPWPWGGRGK